MGPRRPIWFHLPRHRPQLNRRPPPPLRCDSPWVAGTLCSPSTAPGAAASRERRPAAAAVAARTARCWTGGPKTTAAGGWPRAMCGGSWRTRTCRPTSSCPSSPPSTSFIAKRFFTTTPPQIISCFLCSTSCLTHRASRVVAGGVVPEPLGGAGVRPEAGQGRYGRLDGGPQAAQCRLPGLGGAHREGEDQADRACSPHFELCSCSVRVLFGSG